MILGLSYGTTGAALFCIMILNPDVAYAEPGSVTTDIFWLSASYFEEEFADSDS